MEKKALKKDIVDRIKKDGILYGLVANAVDVVPASLTRILLSDNHRKLVKPHVLAVIKKHLGILDNSELLEEAAVTA